jgi:predicted signal transduction protein with EAL and GGDEF domain
MHRLVEKLHEPTNILGTTIHPCASVGMAIFPQDGDTAEELLKSADFKMYLVKHDADAELQPSKQPSPPITHLPDLVQRSRR